MPPAGARRKSIYPVMATFARRVRKNSALGIGKRLHHVARGTKPRSAVVPLAAGWGAH